MRTMLGGPSMSWFRNIFGTKKRLSEFEKRKAKARWVRPENTLDRTQMNAGQIALAARADTFMRQVCENRGWNFSDFEGPYVVVPNKEDLEFFEQMRKERGKEPDYKLWMFDYGNTNGFLRVLADNEEKIHLMIDGYYG